MALRSREVVHIRAGSNKLDHVRDSPTCRSGFVRSGRGRASLVRRTRTNLDRVGSRVTSGASERTSESPTARTGSGDALPSLPVGAHARHAVPDHGCVPRSPSCRARRRSGATGSPAPTTAARSPHPRAADRRRHTGRRSRQSGASSGISVDRGGRRPIGPHGYTLPAFPEVVR
jgi:hypothetical protein